jgi:hypothetical protein
MHAASITALSAHATRETTPEASRHPGSSVLTVNAVWRLRNRGPLRLGRLSCGWRPGPHTDPGGIARRCSCELQQALGTARLTARNIWKSARHTGGPLVRRAVGPLHLRPAGHRLEPHIEVELALFDRSVRQDRFHQGPPSPRPSPGLARQLPLVAAEGRAGRPTGPRVGRVVGGLLSRVGGDVPRHGFERDIEVELGVVGKRLGQDRFHQGPPSPR